MILAFAVVVACTAGEVPGETASPIEAAACAATPAPCVVSVADGELVAVTYTMCCPAGEFRVSILEVSGHGEGNWGDVTRWGLCGHEYTEEFVHPDRTATPPFAILSTFDGDGGEISECRTANAP